MPPYKESEIKPDADYKFVRLEEIIVIEEVRKSCPSHREIAVAEGMFDTFKRIQRQDHYSPQLDAGTLVVNGTQLKIRDDSYSLSVSFNPAQRQKTIDVLQSQSLEHIVDKEVRK